MSKYFAVANANGPISVRIHADSAAHAAAWFKAQEINFVDEGRTDAEDDLDIEGDGMDSAAFAEAMESRGWQPIYLDICNDGHWSLWTQA